ncbi:MAG: DUF5658 family protein [Terriglobales bacterium]|jgi:uncharacterized protein DUF5658
MKYLLSILLLSAAVQAQNFTVDRFALPEAPSQPRFWTLENRVDFGILAGLIAADGVTTQRGLSEGYREVNPVMRPFVTRGAPGEAAGSALGFGAAIGVAYVLHHTHHYKAEHIATRMMVMGESGFVANNIVQLH